MWYYKKHMQGHVLKEIAFRAPLDMETLLESAHNIGGKVLHQMASKPSVGCYAEAYSSLLAQLKEKESDAAWINLVKFLCGHFKLVISKEYFCMPSSLLNTSQKVIEDVLSDEETRNKLYSELEEICPNTPNLIISTFWCEFVHTFADELLIFICRSLREATDQDIPTINFDTEERQCILYVAGSICNGFKRFSYKYPGSKKWRNIQEAIQSKILEDKLPEELTEQEKKDRNWTEGQNRGGLLFIRGSAQRFFLSVAEVVASYEDKRTGSLPIEEIQKKIAGGAAKYDWDNIVGSCLDQDLSFSLMTGVVKSFISTYGKGVIQRRMNDANNNKVTVSMPTRLRAAPR
ncbi:uncharacterized protein LOC127750100 [Frankliniella occidentalis]|uniref:Uncharacterized protein LOC127750100 n=1 Tax=Frankliniella occidentalis TaxID=133901 RepID=A0A9C6WSK3_FRAOC|nr:uncharacterized protein LOC127750100 [Frankliniella occidentalis]